jgi:hypothetical protein
VWLHRLSSHSVINLSVRRDHVDDNFVRALALGPTLRSLAVHSIDPSILAKFTGLSSLSIDMWREEEDFQAIASLPLMRFQLRNYNGFDYSKLPPSDWWSSSLTSLQLPTKTLSDDQLHQLMLRLPSLRDLHAHMNGGADKGVQLLLKSTTLTTINGIFNQIEPKLIASALMPSLQRIGFDNCQPSSTPLPALSIAAPNVTCIDPICIDDGNHKWIAAFMAFKLAPCGT